MEKDIRLQCVLSVDKNDMMSNPLGSGRPIGLWIIQGLWAHVRDRHVRNVGCVLTVCSHHRGPSPYRGVRGVGLRYCGMDGD